MSEDAINKPSKRLPAITVRVTPDDMKRLEKMSTASGKTIPEILRKNTLSRKDLERPILTREQADEILVALSRIGNNLNQISKRINSGLMSGWNQAFNGLYREWLDMKQLFAVNSGLR